MEQSMTEVFLLTHLHVINGNEDIKNIGIYSTYKNAVNAAMRLAKQRGFCDYSEIIDPDKTNSDNCSGFYIDKYTVDSDNWPEGYFTNSE